MGKKKNTNDPIVKLFLQQLEENSLKNRFPSKIKSMPWLHSKKAAKGYPPPTDRSGKWCVFVSKQDHDKWWIKIKTALSKKKLEDEIKTSTGFPLSIPAFSKRAVIIIYTYDYEDKHDVMRIREELRNIGITWKIAYKSDRSSREGKYSFKGDVNLCMYYE